MKTAVEILIEKLEGTLVRSIYERLEREGIFTEALQLESNQIINAHFEGWSDAYDYIYSDSNTEARQAEDYYNETYKK